MKALRVVLSDWSGLVAVLDSIWRYSSLLLREDNASLEVDVSVLFEWLNMVERGFQASKTG